jgi:hypothetical protein
MSIILSSKLKYCLDTSYFPHEQEQVMMHSARLYDSLDSNKLKQDKINAMLNEFKKKKQKIINDTIMQRVGPTQVKI